MKKSNKVSGKSVKNSGSNFSIITLVLWIILLLIIAILVAILLSQKKAKETILRQDTFEDFIGALIDKK